MKELIKCFNNQKIVKVNGHNYLINPITDHTPDTTYKLLNDVIKELSKIANFKNIDKIVGEEDRGGYVAALMALKKKKSLAMVKWNPDELSGHIAIEFRNAYTSGKMYLLGCQKGNNIILVEDFIDTGGTIIGMVKLLKKNNVNIKDIICIAEKAEYGGSERIANEVGIRPKSLIKVLCTGKRSKIIEVNDKKINTRYD